MKKILITLLALVIVSSITVSLDKGISRLDCPVSLGRTR
jgi:hypothetical protein